MSWKINADKDQYWVESSFNPQTNTLVNFFQIFTQDFSKKKKKNREHLCI